MPEAVSGAAGLLAATDPPPFTLLNPNGRLDLLLLCDHATPIVPAALNGLGLEPAVLHRHIGWDIGAAAVTGVLAGKLNAPAVLSGYSRLVIDCNRTADDPTLIPTVSDGVAVPGNQELSAADKMVRAAACFWPYHRAVEAQLDRAAAQSVAPAIISIHSFTPQMSGVDRPWHIGILWDRDPRIPVPMLSSLGAMPGLVIGDNQPYSGRDPGDFTLRHHAVPRGLPHVMIELRQNEIDTEAGALLFAEHLEVALRPILDDPQLYRPALYR